MFAHTRQLAKDLAQQVAEDYPASLQTLTGRKSLDMLARASDKMQERVRELQRRERLGIVGRIVFSRTLQLELVRQGYEQALVRQWMMHVLSALSFANK